MNDVILSGFKYSEINAQELQRAQEVLKMVREKLPGYRIVIAGGAIRDVLLGATPKDYDVFVLKASRGDLLTYENYKKFSYQYDSEITYPTLLASNDMVAHNFRWKPKDVVIGEPLNVQIMASPHDNPKALVEEFDWNCCQYWYEGDSNLVYETEGGKWFRTWNELKLIPDVECLTSTEALKVFKRGVVFSYKYQANMPKSTETALLDKAVMYNDFQILKQMKMAQEMKV